MTDIAPIIEQEIIQNMAIDKIYKGEDGKFRKNGAIQVGKFRMVIDTDEVATATEVGLYGADNFYELIKRQPVGDIQREDGTPYESVAIFEEELDLFITSAVDVNIQDQTSPALITKFNHSTGSTTLTSAGTKFGYDIEVASTAGMVLPTATTDGSFLILFDVGTGRFMVAHLVAINALVVTLDSQLDFDFPI